jgi:hypothetical protein
MSKKSEKGKTKKPSRPRRGKPLSFEAAIFTFAMLKWAANPPAIGHGIMLALRDADLKEELRPWLASHVENIDSLMEGEPTTPPSKAEVRAFVEPFLRAGAETAVYAQIADLYLLRKERTPENLVYAFYNGARFFIAGEREPTDEEKKRIWEIALRLARTSKLGAPLWKELEDKGPVYLKDWIDERKEVARKRYETFLSQMKRATATADEAFKFLMSDMFGDEPEPPQTAQPSESE